MKKKDLKYKKQLSLFLYILIVYILGIVACLYFEILFFALILFVGFVILSFVFKPKAKIFVLLYFVFAFSVLNCKFQIKDYDTLFLNSPNKNVTIKGVISSIPETKNENQTRFYFDVEKFKLNKNEENISLSKPNKTFVYLNENINNYRTLKIGDELILKGNFDIPFESKNPSQFSYRDYLKTKKVFTVFYVKSENYNKIGISPNCKWSFLRQINDIRDGIIYKHSKYLGKHKLELLGGVVFGDDAINPTFELQQSFLHSGLTHLLAASGLNVGLIFAVCFFIFQLLNLPYKLNIILNMGLILLYICMTGFPVPVVRAAIMIEFVLFGKLINREAKSINLISLAAFLMLIKNPLLIKDISFQLSFLVTFGLILSSETFLKYFPFKDKLPMTIKADIIAPIISQIWVLPLQMFYFNSFTLYSIVANILVLPFITIVSFVGFVSAFLALIPYLGNYVIKITDFFLNYLLGLIINISNLFLTAPYSLVDTYKPTILQLLLYYAIIIFLVLNIKQKLKIWLITCLVFVLSLSYIDFKPKTLDIINFSVQNSDMILIKTKKKKYILIDTSKLGFKGVPSQAKMILVKYLKDNNIKNLELVIVTHYDSDHAGGLIDVYENVKVKKTILLNADHKSKCYNDIQKYIKENNINYEYVKNNEKVFDQNDISIVTLYDKNATNENDMSIVTLLKCKRFNALFMGDASFHTFYVLKPFLPQNITYLKSGHHGGKGTINEDMIKYLNPKIVILSTGKNKYYHPHYSTLCTLNKNKINFLRTDYDNAVKIETNGDLTKIYRFNTNTKKFDVK